MRHQDKMKIQRRRRRKLFWLFAALAVCALLFEEQVAVLYVLSTVGLCGLMIVVAFSNLEARDAEQTAAIRESRRRQEQELQGFDGRRKNSRVTTDGWARQSIICAQRKKSWAIY